MWTAGSGRLVAEFSPVIVAWTSRECKNGAGIGRSRLVANHLRFELQIAGFLGDEGVPFAPILVAGSVADPDIYNLPYLTPVSDVSVTYQAAGTPVSDSYTGIKLIDLLNDAGGVNVTAAKNDILSKYVVATGSDGYKAALSLGEISPKFGNQPVLVAFADANGQLGPNGSEGLAGWWFRAIGPAAATCPTW